MPLPAAVLYPPFNILRLSHVEYRVTDLARARAFYVDMLGLQITHETEEQIYLRAMEERGHHCICLTQSDRAEAGHLGFKLFDEPDLDKAEAWLKEQGLETVWTEKSPLWAGSCKAVIPMACRWNFIARWTGCPPSISIMRFIAG